MAKPKSYKPPQRPIEPETIPEIQESSTPILTPKPGVGMAPEELETLLATAQVPTETIPPQTKTPIKQPTTKTTEKLEPSIEPQAQDTESEAKASDTGLSVRPFEKQFQSMQDQIRRRWPKNNVAQVIGQLSRSGVVSQLPDWDIDNAGAVTEIILNRLQNEAYLRSLWNVVCLMKTSKRGNHLGNPMVEATMATGLAVMDFVNERCPRPNYHDLAE